VGLVRVGAGSVRDRQVTRTAHRSRVRRDTVLAWFSPPETEPHTVPLSQKSAFFLPLPPAAQDFPEDQASQLADPVVYCHERVTGIESA
jgi:hypothetical protein